MILNTTKYTNLQAKERISSQIKLNNAGSTQAKQI